MAEDEAPQDEEQPAEDAQEDTGGDAGESGDSGDDEGGGGGNSKKMILMIVLPILVLLGVGGGLYFSGFLDSFLKSDAPAHEESADEHAEDTHAAPVKDDHGGGHDDGHGDGHDDGHGGDSSFVEIPTMIVNLNTGDDDTPRYLRLSVQLELKNAADSSKVEAVIPRVIDQFQTYLRELRVEDLRGSAGIYRLQMELLWRVNQAAEPVEIKDVLFQEILIQ